MVIALLAQQQGTKARFIGAGHERPLAEMTLPLGVLLREDVTLVRAMAPHAAGAREAYALSQCAFGFLLRHLRSLFSHQPSAISSLDQPEEPTADR
jgi:hypothetical protein